MSKTAISIQQSASIVINDTIWNNKPRYYEYELWQQDELSKSIPRTPSFCREEGVVASIHLQEKAWKPKMHSIAVTILTIHLDNWKGSLTWTF